MRLDVPIPLVELRLDVPIPLVELRLVLSNNFQQQYQLLLLELRLLLEPLLLLELVLVAVRQMVSNALHFDHNYSNENLQNHLHSYPNCSRQKQQLRQDLF